MNRVRSSERRRFRSVYIPALGGMAACYSLGCGGGAEPERGLQRSQSELTAQAPGAGASCDELLARLKSNLLAQVATLAEQARSNPYLPVPVFSEPAPAARGSALPVPQAPSSGTGSPPFSTTTPLVSGVDPADLIKADGDRIYLVHDTSLLVLDASDASDTRLLATVPLGDGSPAELLVYEGRAVVFSNVYEGVLGAPRPIAPYLYPSYFAKLTVVDATGDSPRITRESYFEGSYASAARAGSVARSFIQQYSGVGLDYPPVSYVDIFGEPRSQEDIDRQIELWVELTTETIEESTIGDYLPEQYERLAGQLLPVPVSCSSLALSSASQSSLGTSAVVSIDLAAADPRPASIPLFGYYAQAASFSENVAVMFEQHYGGPIVAPAEVRGIFHVFEFDGTQGSYAGSVSVPGYLNGAIGVDEASGVISAALQRDVYDSEQGYLRSASRLHTFGLQQGQVSVLGESADLPGEYAQAVRFDGDRAYLTSYTNDGAQLLVADLSDPTAPAVAGSLALSTGSSLLVPFGSDQLLTFTPSSDPVTFVSEYALQVLDVQDPAAPALGAQLALGQDFYSDALYDARAITFHPERAVFALPLQSYVDGSSSLDVFQLSDSGLQRLGGVVHERAEPTLLECLLLLGYPTDPEFVGTLDEDFSAILLQECNYYRFGVARRGLLRGNDVFALSTAALTAQSLDALSEPLSTVELPLPNPYPVGPRPAPIDVVPGPPAESPPPPAE